MDTIVTVPVIFRVVVECEPLWLELVGRDRELTLGPLVPERAIRHTALAACGVPTYLDEIEAVYVCPVDYVDPRHSAIRPGDLCVFRISGGIYSEIVGVWIVRRLGRE